MRRVLGKESDQLSPQQAVFVAEYLKTNEKRDSAIKAGIHPESAAQRAWSWLNEYPAVMKAVRDHIKSITDTIPLPSRYDYDRAIAEAESLREAAMDAGNLSVASSMVQHKAKLSGLLVDKLQVQAGFSLVIEGLPARNVQPLLQEPRSDELIEIESNPVEKQVVDE